jgi:hypothetical protein
MKLEEIMKKVRRIGRGENIEEKEKSKIVKDIFTELVNKLKIEIRLRK